MNVQSYISFTYTLNDNIISKHWKCEDIQSLIYRMFKPAVLFGSPKEVSWHKLDMAHWWAFVNTVVNFP